MATKRKVPGRNLHSEGSFKVKAASDGSVYIEGWANKAVVDRGNDLIGKDAWDLGNYQKSGIILFNHNKDQPIGKAVQVEANDGGLYVKAQISASKDPFVSYIRDMVQEGILNAFSVGFDAKDEARNADGVNQITKAELYEISVVTLPMNQDSIFNLSSKEMAKMTYKDVKSKILTSKGAWVAGALQNQIYSLQDKGNGFDRTAAIQKVADASGSSLEDLKNILAGETTPVPPAILKAFADVLGLDVAKLESLDKGDVAVGEKPKVGASADAQASSETPPPPPAKDAASSDGKGASEGDKPTEAPVKDAKSEVKDGGSKVGVQSLEFSKDSFATETDAAAWASQNGWKADPVVDDGDAWKIDQEDAAAFAVSEPDEPDEQFSELDLGEGVTANVGIYASAKGVTLPPAGAAAQPPEVQPVGIPAAGDVPPAVGEQEIKKSMGAGSPPPMAPPSQDTQGNGTMVGDGNPVLDAMKQTNVLLGSLIQAVQGMSAKLDGMHAAPAQGAPHAPPPAPPMPAKQVEDETHVAKMLQNVNNYLENINKRLGSLDPG